MTFLQIIPGGEESFFRMRMINSFVRVLSYDAELISIPLMQPANIQNKFDSADKFIDSPLIEKGIIYATGKSLFLSLENLTEKKLNLV